MSLTWALVAPVVACWVAAFVAWVKPRWSVGAGLVATVGAVAWILLAPSGVVWGATFLGFEVAPVFVDGLTRTVSLVFGAIGVAAVVYAKGAGAGHRLVSFALMYVGSTFGALLAGDWLSLLVWWEVMAVVSTLLVWQHGGKAVRAGFRYAVLHGLGGSLLFVAVVMQGIEAGTFLYDGGLIRGLPAVFGALGIGVNVGFVGLHAWLPDTYPSPHVAASVFLSVYTTKLGVYALLRGFPEGHAWIAIMGASMALFGVLMALLQDDMRRLLSYSIQSQVGYMVAAVGIAGALARDGALAHLVNHILYKALLFMVAGVVIYRTGRERLSRLGGLGRAMPWTVAVFAVAALSIAGFPGVNGFVSKGVITDAAKQALGSGFVYWALLVTGVGTTVTFLKFAYLAFIRDAPEDLDVEGIEDARGVHKGVMVAVAGACLVLAVPGVLFTVVAWGSSGLGALAHAHPYSWGHLEKAGIVALIAIVGFWVLRGPLSRPRRVPDVDAVYNPGVFYAARGVLRGIGALRAGVDAAFAWGTGRVRSALEDPLPGERAPIGLSVFLVTLVLVLALIVALL